MDSIIATVQNQCISIHQQMISWIGEIPSSSFKMVIWEDEKDNKILTYFILKDSYEQQLAKRIYECEAWEENDKIIVKLPSEISKTSTKIEIWYNSILVRGLLLRFL